MNKRCKDCEWYSNGQCSNPIVWDSCVETLLNKTGNAAPSCKRFTAKKNKPPANS